MVVELNFEGVRVSGRVAPEGTRGTFRAAGSIFIEARFEQLTLKDVRFGSAGTVSQYTDCSFNGSRLSLAPGGRAKFVRCTFEDVRISNWHLSFADLIDCRFSGWIDGGIFSARNEYGLATVRGNDFSRARLNDVAFRGGIDLREQQLPSGPDYLYLREAAAALEAARSEIIGWYDLAARRDALAYLSSLEMDLQAGQYQLLVQRDLKVPGGARTWGRFAEVLAQHSS